jgi:uncharacterized membrane protein (UPF0136 family)
MRQPPESTVRRVTVGVALAVVVFGLVLVMWPFVSFLAHSPYGLGLNSRLLTQGREAILCGGFRAAPASQVIRPRPGREGHDKSSMYEWEAGITGDCRVAPGTPCVVTIDPAWDTDSSSEGRPIAVRLALGEHAGSVVAVPRRLLRTRRQVALLLVVALVTLCGVSHGAFRASRGRGPLPIGLIALGLSLSLGFTLVMTAEGDLVGGMETGLLVGLLAWGLSATVARSSRPTAEKVPVASSPVGVWDRDLDR